MKFLIAIFFIFVLNISHVLSDNLYDALKITYKNNKELNAERENVNIAEQDLKISKGNYLPSGTITGSKSQQDTNKLTNQSGGDAAINDVDPLNTTIKLEQTLIDFGRNAELKKSKLGLNLSKEKLKKTEQEIFYKAIEAYSNLIASTERVKINERNLNLLTRQVENDKTRLEIGQITLSDLSQSESSLAGAEAKNIKAINDLTTSKLNYENVIGKINNVDNLNKTLNPISPLPKSLSEAIEISNNNNPDIIIARIEYEQSEKDIKISKADLAPTATLSVERSNTEDFSSTIDETKSRSKLIIENFKVKNAPGLVQLLSLADFGGMTDALSGEGLSFDKLEMMMEKNDKILNLKELYAIGPSISILMEGYVDSKTGLVSLRGTMVPAKTLNKFLSKVPFLGDILIPKEIGEGLFGISFKMKGPPGKIKTSVNPIKTLTPRFIQKALGSK